MLICFDDGDIVFFKYYMIDLNVAFRSTITINSGEPILLKEAGQVQKVLSYCNREYSFED